MKDLLVFLWSPSGSGAAQKPARRARAPSDDASQTAATDPGASVLLNCYYKTNNQSIVKLLTTSIAVIIIICFIKLLLGRVRSGLASGLAPLPSVLAALV